MSIAIKFEKVSKNFTLRTERPRTFQELWVGLWRRQVDTSEKLLWVLRNISFEIEQGDSIAIIGSNGAGKSTMLKLISRIMPPTLGKIEVNGRVGALLELGSGFQPDMTGRENIYLNGAILGLGREYISRIEQRIIDFSELSRFIDMPVKHYSSGMSMRLGFSIAIHTEPDILVVDEVLAVGDQVFQQKCLDRIFKLKKEGITIVLVSHSLGDVWKLCERAIWLKDGLVEMDATSRNVADFYMMYSNELFYQQRLADSEKEREIGEIIEDDNIEEEDEQEEHAHTSANRWGTHNAEITNVELLDENQNINILFKQNDYFCLRIFYKTNERIETPTFGLAFYRRDGVHVNGPNSVQEGYHIPELDGEGVMDYVIKKLPLNPGEYELTIAIYNRDSTIAHDHHHRMYPFTVLSQDVWQEEGVVHIDAEWKHASI
ncbi:MAG: hypothetical protein B6242_08985 [Anaerolineaceae bacterium 4572_78]|nr:MAG: hypothetical protein B6242_08985 [Anaerolineaceae bacterium 4572_78]